MKLFAWLAFLVMAAEPAMAEPPADRPGQRFHVRPADMPEPFITPSASNGSRLVRRRTDQLPIVPPGFRVNGFSIKLSHARWMAVAPSGEVFLAQSRIGEVTLLIDTDGDGRADEKSAFTAGFRAPHGLALHGGSLFVADVQGVWRVPFKPGDRKATSIPVRITPDGAFGVPGGHWTRNIVFAPDGRHFYVAIGSEGNVAVEPPPRATIKRFDIDGSNGKVFAHGLRNAVGIAFHPKTGTLYTVVNERDGMGDGLVPDYLTQVEENGFYGWPYAYIGPNPMPGFHRLRPDLVAQSITPDVLFESHSAPIGMVFADSDQFPPDWRDDAFVALKGSWTPSCPPGTKSSAFPSKKANRLAGMKIS